MIRESPFGRLNQRPTMPSTTKPDNGISEITRNRTCYGRAKIDANDHISADDPSVRMPYDCDATQ